MDTFQETIKEAEECFKKIESKVNALNDLNQGLPGTVACMFVFQQYFNSLAFNFSLFIMC